MNGMDLCVLLTWEIHAPAVMYDNTVLACMIT